MEKHSSDGPASRLDSADWRALGLLILLAAALYIPWLGHRHITTSDEAQRAYPPVEMLETGDWIVPRINGELYLKKPPLLYWAMMPVYRVFGVNEWSARILCALASISIAAIVFLWAREMSTLRIALIAGVFTATNYLIIDKARECQLDIFVALFSLLTMRAWWRGLEFLHRGIPGAPRQFLIGALWLALGHLCKFPVPFLFVLMPVVGSAICMRRWKWLVRADILVPALLSVVPVAIWALLAVWRVGAQTTTRIWSEELYLHLEQAEGLGLGPMWYYIPPLIASFVPWCALYPILFLTRFRRMQRPRRLAFHFLWTAAAGSLLFLSLNTAKETKYMVAVVPPICILLAWAWEYWQQRMPVYFPPLLRSDKLLKATVVVYLLAMWVWNPIYENEWNERRSPIATVARVQEEESKGRPVAVYKRREPQLLFYLGGTRRQIEKPDALRDFLQANPYAIIISSKDDRDDFMTDYPNFRLDRIVKPPRRLKWVPYQLVPPDAPEPPPNADDNGT